MLHYRRGPRGFPTSTRGGLTACADLWKMNRDYTSISTCEEIRSAPQTKRDDVEKAVVLNSAWRRPVHPTEHWGRADRSPSRT